MASLYRICFIFVNILVCHIDLSCSFNYYNNSPIGHFNNILIRSDHIFIGGKTGIVKLNKADLQEILYVLINDVWLMIFDDATNDVMSCYMDTDKYSQCSKYDEETLVKKNKSSSEIFAIDQTYPAVYQKCRLADKDGFFVASNSVQKLYNKDKHLGIYSWRLDNMSEFRYQLFQMNYKKTKNFIRSSIFKASFVYSKFAYFLYNVFENELFVGSKIGKMCTTGDATIHSQFPTSYEDMPLICCHDNTNYTHVEAGIIVNDTVLVSFSNDMSSVICTYNVTDLEENYRDSRIEKLRCNQPTRPTNRYFEPNLKWNPNTCIYAENKTCLYQMVRIYFDRVIG